MPQNTAHDRLSGEISERERTQAWGIRVWLTRLLSDWRIGDREKLVAIALSALLRGRHGRRLLRRLLVESVFFIYEYLIVVEVIGGILVLAEVAARLIPLFTRTAQANRGDPADSNSAPDTSGSDGSNRTTTGNHGDDRTRPNRLQEAIQHNLQQLAMAAAAAEAKEVAANVAPSLLPDHQRGCLTIENPERNGATLAVTTFNSGSNSQATAASPRATFNTGRNSQATAASPRATFNTGRNSQATAAPPRARARATSRQTPHSNPDLSTIVRSQDQRNPRNPTEGPSRRLQPEQPVLIHLQLPIYVCDLIFWNDIHITLPSLSRPSSPPSGANRGSRSGGGASDAAGLIYRIKIQMWMEVNRDLAEDVGYGIHKKPCKDCLMGSHSVGKRHFDCTYLDGCLDGDLDEHKNTFHAGRKLTILGSNRRLNFRFETILEQTRHRKTGPASVQQRAMFALLAPTANLKRQGSTGQQKYSKLNTESSPKGQRRSMPGLLAGVLRRNSAYTPVAKCSVEAVYKVEDRRLVTRENSENSQLGMVQNGLDERLCGSTIASRS